MRNQAVGYLRVSGLGQIDGDGFPRQREAVATYAKRAGFELVGEYRDEGVSGTADLDHREGLGDLLARIRSNGVRVVLVERADRLARDLVVGELILDEFRKLGVRVIAADSGTELTVGDDDPTRKLIRQVLGAVAEFDRAVTVAKLRAARIRKRRELGRCEGRKPFGAHPGEGEALAFMVKLNRKPRNGERLSYGEIAKRLNEAGHAPRKAEKWCPESVREILKRVGASRA